MASHRLAHANESIKRELSVIMRDMKDPRIKDKMLTVARLEVAQDISFATIYISALEGVETAKKAVEGLSSAKGFIRRELGQRLKLRHTPDLKFIADDSIEYGIDMIQKIEKLTREE